MFLLWKPGPTARSAGHLPLCHLDQSFLKSSHADLGGYSWHLGLLCLWLENRRCSDILNRAESRSRPYWALAVSLGRQPGSCRFLIIQALTAALQKMDDLKTAAASLQRQDRNSDIGECTFGEFGAKQGRCDKKTEITGKQNAPGKHNQSVRCTNGKNRWRYTACRVIPTLLPLFARHSSLDVWQMMCNRKAFVLCFNNRKRHSIY